MKTIDGKEVYHSQDIRAWEQRWFAAGNSSYGLMQQAALAIDQAIQNYLNQNSMTHRRILVWCGAGNNGGDGYLTAFYLQQAGYHVAIFAAYQPISIETKCAEQQARAQQIQIYSDFPLNDYDIHIDALFGNGLNRELNDQAQQYIKQFNQVSGIKIALDLPSGLHPDHGIPMPVATKVDLTLTVMALKTGLLIAQAQAYVGDLYELPLIPKDGQLIATAYFNKTKPVLASRLAFQHKGDFGHVLVIGGHPKMGGAVMMSGEAAIATGAGKVTIMCDPHHHTAILARSPNIMLQDITQLNEVAFNEFLQSIDSVCFGMGFGRDQWAAQFFQPILQQLLKQTHLKALVLDADALWFLADLPEQVHLPEHCIATPHSGEAARLLHCSVAEIESDRITAIHQLQRCYGGQWILKGAGSLSLQNNRLEICAFGNPGMATAGMGDVLSGMMAGLKAQFSKVISIAEIVSLHALAGDRLAQHGMRGLQAHHMSQAIYQVVNGVNFD
ncbi:bifunctional ADP-dependent NAD(P)H-hydrate dehydratase/NAD(P)H-hydrate epimerase [Acinetobacter qingfengensis]|uniref:Bifunctional NAD(P)H-hydrate repair enzyme n=1 Tax=Acinetobacter qingfengensis TaxID=1262585 RepID=A0A1E7R9A7_9GAMM|nr:bifunctional ADP-dependent NAD(P)H-hydrate dehydratase/NAD(P)H-hydrate epimerase [Acinetobacter qingfengensis]KAA8735507.1 bifunctional ADP-dependent NAD(P)H-hydrate dehydratase/NAD(P)H-hydrate epimerase [Acinetobacter qingfengensis]OEY95847.1 bifunctional ADP-dependent (S)-NAD(P)H-hydrate dehydratase/NAD(P)H-hydrate epimerase [Acinetobacter qingfengensis]